MILAMIIRGTVKSLRFYLKEDLVRRYYQLERSLLLSTHASEITYRGLFLIIVQCRRQMQSAIRRNE